MGLTNFDLPSLAKAGSIPARARPVNPPPVSQRNSRRVRPQNCVAMGIASGRRTSCQLVRAAEQAGSLLYERASIEIHELVTVQRQQAVQPQPVRARLLHERHVLGDLLGTWLAA